MFKSPCDRPALGFIEQEFAKPKPTNKILLSTKRLLGHSNANPGIRLTFRQPSHPIPWELKFATSILSHSHGD